MSWRAAVGASRERVARAGRPGPRMGAVGPACQARWVGPAGRGGASERVEGALLFGEDLEERRGFPGTVEVKDLHEFGVDAADPELAPGGLHPLPEIQERG